MREFAEVVSLDDVIQLLQLMQQGGFSEEQWEGALWFASALTDMSQYDLEQRAKNPLL